MPLLSWGGYLSPDLCRRHPDAVFLFGDNTSRNGQAGQACIRRCFNAFGIPTKRHPGMLNDDFFVDDNPADMRAVVTAVRMAQVMAKGLDIVVPINPDGTVSLGCGLSELPERAPGLYKFIASQLAPEGQFYV